MMVMMMMMMMMMMMIMMMIVDTAAVDVDVTGVGGRDGGDGNYICPKQNCTPEAHVL